MRSSAGLGRASAGATPSTVFLLAAALLAAGLTGCSRSGSSALPAAPIVLISIDTLRSDHLPAYGYEAVATPALDRLRRDGILFEHVYAHVPLTFPSHVTMLTGLLPSASGVHDNLGYHLDAEALPYLPRLLRAAGYATGAAVSAKSLDGSLGLATGFDRYDDSFGSKRARSLGEAQRPGKETLARALDWLDGLPEGRPFFLFLHLYEPHSPYAPPEPWATRFASAYDGEIATADDVVGSLLAALDQRGLYDSAAILLTSDHGEGLGDHGEFEHGILLYRESLQVPLILKLPGAERAGATVAAPAQLVDVFATLAAIGGAEEAAAASSGTDLRALAAASPDTPADRPIFAETFYPRLQFGWSDLGSVILGSHHLIAGVERELYDLDSDPAEQTDLLQDRREVARRLDRALGGYDRSFTPRSEGDGDRRALLALGYLAGSGGADGDELADPKAEIHTLEDLRTGMLAFRRGDWATARPALLAAVAQQPRLADAWYALARTTIALGDREGAAEIYRKALAQTKGSAILAEDAVQLFVDLGRTREAFDLVETSLEREPDSRALRSLAVRLLVELGRVDEALERARRAVADEPQAAGAWYDLAIVARYLGDDTTAETALRRTVELAPGHVNALNDLAVLVASQGNLEEAIALERSALRVEPDHPLAKENLEAFLAKR